MFSNNYYVSTVANILGFITVTVMALAFFAQVYRPCRFYARIAGCYLLLLTCASYGVAASLALRAFGLVSLAQWTTARSMRYLGCLFLGVSFDVEGEEHLEIRPAVFVSNHQSELDILFLGRAFPRHCSVTAKRSLKYLPFLGWFMALSGTVFIDRSNRKNAIDAMNQVAADIRDKRQSVWIFPEGTRSYFTKPDLLPFKKGAFHLAVQAGVPIVPVAVQNYSHILNVSGRTFESGLIKVKVLEPISTKGLTSNDVDALVEKTRNIMLAEIQAMGLPNKPVKKE